MGYLELSGSVDNLWGHMPICQYTSTADVYGPPPPEIIGLAEAEVQ